MKKSLSHQFVAILLIPIIIILATSYYIISYSRKEQDENLRKYCNTSLNNIELNMTSLTSHMKKTATMFSSKPEMQNYLFHDTYNNQPLQRQDFFDLIDLSTSYLPELIDVIIWDKHTPTSMISYIPADMENFAVEHFQNEQKNQNTYFDFYIQPKTKEPFLIYFSPIFMSTFSENFGEYMGNIAIICKTTTFSKLMYLSQDMQIYISDTNSGKTLYSNSSTEKSTVLSESIFYNSEQKIFNTNLTVTGILNSESAHPFKGTHSELLILLVTLSVFFIVYIAFSVHHIIIKPIHKLNMAIESIDYEQKKLQLHTPLKNEIGSIAHYVNDLLEKVSILNQNNIHSQARLYEMELSQKQAQIYAYQSQINPHFLYNMLQCMRGICLIHGVTEVAQICTNMADLFRYSIKGGFLVDLKDELNIIDKYLYMIRIRFQDRITYTLDVSEDTKSCKIPKMILQPLVENAIFHGLDSIEDNGFIHIQTFCENDSLFITIQDNGVGFDQDTLNELQTFLVPDEPSTISITASDASKGIGILNIHNKIRLFEGPEYGISLESTPGNTLVTIHLNALQNE